MSKKRKTKKKTNKKDDLIIKEIQVSNNEEFYNILENDKDNKFLKLLFLIILLILGSFIVHDFVIKDKKRMFTSGINKTYEVLANKLIKISRNDLFKDNLEISSALKIDSNDKELSTLSDYLYYINLDLNKNDNNYLIDLNIEKDNTNVSNIKYYYLNNQYYLNLGNNYEKTIKLDNSILNINSDLLLYNNINFNKLNTSIKSIKNIINSNINKDNLSLGNETINNKDYEYIMLSYKNDEFAKLLSKSIDDIKNNNSLISNLCTSFKTNENEINNYLDNILKNVLITKFDTLNIKYYTTGIMSSIVGLKISIDNKNIIYYINDNEYSLKLNKDEKYNIVIKKDNNDYLTLKFKELKENLFDLDYKYFENNATGNIHYSKFNKNNNESGNLIFTNINKDITTSINLDYQIDNYKPFNINETIYINELSKEDYKTIDKNIKYSLQKNIIKDYILEKIKAN